jgi:hypothetical protein
MPQFSRYIGISYSGAQVPDISLPGLRVYEAAGGAEPVEVKPPPSPRWYFTRREIAEWLVATISQGEPALVGIDHAFSFPWRYFKNYGLPADDWPGFLDDFVRHWPTDREYVINVLAGMRGNGLARLGKPSWRRLTDERAGRTRSLFHFDGPASIARATHAGLPWLRFLRRELGERLHVWPIDGWEVPAGVSAIAEVPPDLWRRSFPSAGRTRAQHTAFTIAAWLSRADREGRLPTWLNAGVTAREADTAMIEGWILGVLGSAFEGDVSRVLH